MRVVELERLTPADWRRLIDGEEQPWGGVGEQLVWRDKDRTVGVVDDRGRLVAAGGLVVVQASIGARELLHATGLGGVIVTHSARGRGYARLVLERLLEIAAGLEPSLALLFCTPANVPLYAKFGFQQLPIQIRARQPEGTIEVPMEAMWRGLREGATWPSGSVELLAEPF